MELGGSPQMEDAWVPWQSADEHSWESKWMGIYWAWFVAEENVLAVEAG